MAQHTLNTPREETHQRIADALEDIVDKIVDTSSAGNIDYDNTQSGLSANKVQGAIDELASEKADKSTTLAGYGITDAYTKAEVYTQSEVNNIVSTLETNIDWKEAVNTYADIATTYPNPQDGWTVNVKDTDYTYRYNGSEWVAISANAIPEATASVKGLMTPTQVSKLNGIEAGAQVNTVTSVAGKTGAVTLTKSDVGLGNVDNTSDLNKPISTAAQTALNDKIDKVQGKGLSTNDYTNEEKQKLANIESNAQANVQSDWNEVDTEDDGYIKNKPDLSTSLTATGNPLTIESSESNLVECVAEVEAVQDLHGYVHPWVGGAGKNKLPMTVDGIKSANTGGTWNENSYAENGVTFTILTDSDGNITNIKIQGTPTSRAQLSLVNGYILNTFKGMILSGANKNYSGNNGIYVGYSDDGNSWVAEDFQKNNDVTIQNYNYVHFDIMCSSGTFDDDFKPMIRLSTETDATFAPYTNICPISGRTEVVITQKDNLTNPTVTKTYTVQLGQTVYGGQLDVTRGKMVVDRAEVDLGSLTWVKSSYIDSGFYASLSYRYASDTVMVASSYNYLGTTKLGSIILSSKPNGTLMCYYDETQHIYEEIYIRDDRYTDATTFKTAVTGQTLVYELATPYTIQLTPQQIRLLEGTNNLSCNTGDLSIKYYPDNVLGQLKGDIEKGLNAYYDYQIQALWDKINELQA